MKHIVVEELPLKPEQDATYSIESNNLNAYTHGFFKYPCKFIPHIPRWAIKRYITTENNELIDPFCGSGTSLVEGVIHGKTCYGIDVDPFSKLLAEVKTTPFVEDEMTELLMVAELIENRLKKKVGPILIPKIPNMDKWFSKTVINDLGRLKAEIDSDTEENSKIRKFLYITFASIIRKVSNADDQSPKPYVSTRFKKEELNTTNTFFNYFKKFVEKIKEFSSLKSLGKASVIESDARSLPKEIKGEIQLAITSPPYINAFDYVRSLKLENLWLGIVDYDGLLKLRPKYVGTENITIKDKGIPTHKLRNLQGILNNIHKVDKKRAWVVHRFFEDMETNISEIYNILRKRGCYTIVIGESRIRGIRIPTHEILADIATQKGFSIDNKFSYEIKNRYLRFPRQGRGGFIKKDWVVSLIK
ncbi:MAG: modification methylase [Candidatus Hodarchaeota archaeon]